MKIGRLTLSGVSVALLIVQLLLVSSIAAKYFYQRWRCPRVWTRALAYDPQLPMRGRYLSLQLTVDGCQSTLPSAKMATFPRDVNGSIKPGTFSLRQSAVVFHAYLKVDDGRLVAMRVEGQDDLTEGEEISAWPGARCDEMHLDSPVSFYIADIAKSPLPLKPDQELWIEVTVPPKGQPRPIELALKQGSAWTPLAFH